MALISDDVELAARVLRAGGLVGLPTETVYGLAADARNVAAVARVFAVKGRPADHPLIVHLPGAGELDAWARDIPTYARRLADALWPGPLTLVMARTALAGDHLTGGQDTVGLRVPAHPLAQRVLAAFGGALAAPSANRFGRVSPTTAAHVLAELGDELVAGRDLVLDGGASVVGVESTILDCTGQAPIVLRPGAIGPQEIERLGGVRVLERPSAIRAPGTLASHYAPRAEVVVLSRAQLDETALDGQAPSVGLLAPREVATPRGVVRLAAPADDEAYARALYGALREADSLGLTRVIAVAPQPGSGLALAIADRLQRAAAC